MGNEIQENLLCLQTNALRVETTPVSYTHLDVYKRQILDFVVFDVIFFFLIVVKGVLLMLPI